MSIETDISEVEARRLLSVGDNDPRTLDRRRFLRLVGLGLGTGVLAGGLDELIRAGLVGESVAEAATPIGSGDGILVLVGLDGGVDALNTVVPYADGNYYAQHGALALPASSLSIINSQVGLHPSLRYVRSLYDLGEVAVLQGIGYPSPSFSHFSSMATWMHGSTIGGLPSTGWIGRWLDGFPSSDLFRAISVGSALPLSMKGTSRRGTAVSSWGLGFGGGTSSYDQRMHEAMRAFGLSSAARGTLHDAVAAAVRDVIDVGQDVGPAYARTLPDSDLARKLTIAARIVNADIGARVVDTSTSGYDTHANQPVALSTLLEQLDGGLRAFFTSLDDRFRSRVTVLVYSEFGRTSWANNSAGTDHGAAGVAFAIGRGVRGGLYGAQPPLAGLGRWDRMAHQVDFRQVYAGLLDGWLGGGSSTVLGSSVTPLSLFASAPGAGVATGAVPASALGDFVPVAPARLYDTRSAPRRLPLGAGTAGEVQVLGAAGIPTTGVTAVAVRVTGVSPTSPTSVTVWPTGVARPSAASLRAAAGGPASGMVVAKVGSGGRLAVFNDQGDCDVAVDVIGYFRSTSAGRLVTVHPGRALDTRSGLGGRTGALAANTTFDVAIRGIAGVPKSATAALVSLTAVSPTAAGALTAYQSGTVRPTAGTMPFAAGRNTSSTMLVRLSSTGRITVHNSAGSTHVLVDVLGYVGSSTSGRLFPLAPWRLLDTTGDVSKRFGAGTVRAVPVLGVGGVPATGVSAVLVALGAVNPSSATTLLAWANGVTRPTAGSVCTSAGVSSTQLVAVRVGSGGAIQIHNASGETDVVVDIVGYLT